MAKRHLFFYECNFTEASHNGERYLVAELLTKRFPQFYLVAFYVKNVNKFSVI